MLNLVVWFRLSNNFKMCYEHIKEQFITAVGCELLENCRNDGVRSSVVAT